MICKFNLENLGKYFIVLFTAFSSFLNMLVVSGHTMSTVTSFLLFLLHEDVSLLVFERS